MEKSLPAFSAAKKTDLEAALDSASLPFVGQWNKLVTTTNWEKGRIIHEWREAMMASGRAVSEYSDEAWRLRVAGVSGQHAGRLRRVFQRFDATREQYPGLYWSRFQSALDWEDADAWLAQAAERGWSVTHMRNARWETLGVPAEERAADAAATREEVDDDFDPVERESARPDGIVPRREQVHGAGQDESAAGPRIEGPDFGEDDDAYLAARKSEFASPEEPERAVPAPVRPFEQIGNLPDDVVEAFDGYKLAILRHKREGWREISRDEMLATLDALKELALAPASEPASEPAPF